MVENFEFTENEVQLNNDFTEKNILLQLSLKHFYFKYSNF